MYVRGIRSHGGASSERNIAIPMLTGTPRRRARAEVTSVPYTNGAAPYTSGATEFQVVPPKNPNPNARMDGVAARARTSVITARSATTPIATRAQSPWKRVSPRGAARRRPLRPRRNRTGSMPRLAGERSSRM